ncbi:MAG: hypothetical protein ACK535_16495, partial [Cyanobacteriota bacterium]
MKRGIGCAVFIEKVACGIDLKTEVVDGIEDRINKVVALKQLAGPVVDQAVKASFPISFVIAMGIDECLQAAGIGAYPGVEGDQVFWGEHQSRRLPNGSQARRDELIQGIGCSDARRQGRGIGGATQARIPAQPADHLIQASA